MKLSHLAIVAVLASVATGHIGHAQSANSKVAPAEFPPASYKGTQYVDSRGCVYIRAGVDGNVSWIPRLTRQRKHICGQQPSQVAGATKQAQPKQSGRVVQITLSPEDQPTQKASVTRRPAVATKPATQKVASAAAVTTVQPKQPSIVRRTAVATPKPVKKAPVRVAAPKTATVQQPKPVSAPTPRVVRRVVKAPVAAPTPAPTARAPAAVRTTVAAAASSQQSVCPGKSTLSQRYVPNDTKFPFRCGSQNRTNVAAAVPQSKTRASIAPQTSARTLAGPVPSTSLPSSTRVLPRHLANQRANVGDFTVPEGYRPAWEDDRLNPRRAEGTLGGRDRMNLVWTSEVPRRLIDRNTGRDVTAKVALVYPYTDVAAQQRDLGSVTLITKNGQRMKRIVRNKPGKKVAATRRPAPTAAVVASRSIAPKKASPKTNGRVAAKAETLQGKRYVQVGTFGVKGNAQATAARLKRNGIPVRIGKFAKGGKTLRMVLAGPFADDATTTRALRAVQKAGFSDAFIRR